MEALSTVWHLACVATQSSDSSRRRYQQQRNELPVGAAMEQVICGTGGDSLCLLLQTVNVHWHANKAKQEAKDMERKYRSKNHYAST